MKNRIVKIFVVLIMILIIHTSVLANVDILTLKLSTDKDEVKVGNKVKVTVSWDKGMQAAGFSLKYDEELFEFVKTDLEDVYINSKTGNVKVAWFSSDDTDKSKVDFTFKAKKSGESKFLTQINGGFATGELETPKNYKNDEITLKVKNGSKLIDIMIIMAGIIILIIIFIFVKKSKVKKKRKNIKYAIKK